MNKDDIRKQVEHYMWIPDDGGDLHSEFEEEKGHWVIFGDSGMAAPHAAVRDLITRCESYLANTDDEGIAEYNRCALEDEIQIEVSKLSTKVKNSERRGGFVYLMRNHRNGFTKIGFSKAPKIREATLQSQEPEITILHSWPGTLLVEEEIHTQFAPQRIRGEWFRLDEVDISLIEARMTGTGGF